MKKLTVLLICCLTSMVMTAAPVTAEQAKQAAIKFLSHKSSNRRTAKALNLQRRVLNAVSINERPMVYAFNVGENDGFVLVSGSDLTDEVIGYSDHGTFDEEQMPDNMRSWLENYAKSVRQLEVSGKTLNKTITRKATKTYIAPLLECQWDQSTPYNNMCPLLSDGTLCATGCTNTAFAQVMYYHKWPKEATKTIPGYNPNDENKSAPIMPTLEPTIFHWDQMYPTYKNNEDGNEVAKLMLYVGTASESSYGKETNATGYLALEGLKNYFGYDKGAQNVWRYQCNYEEWVDMLYAELAANRPVPFSGSCMDNAHSFVIDGYAEEDYFHVNWGWGGLSDGFFKVSLLDPSNQGIGGSVSNGAYTMDQVAFIGIQPSQGQGKTDPITLTIEKAQVYDAPEGSNVYDILGEKSSSPYYENGYTLLPNIVIYNNNPKTEDYDLGVRLVKDDESVILDYPWMVIKNLYSGIPFTTPTTDFIFIDPKITPQLVSGDYFMYFTCKLHTSKEWQAVRNWEKHYLRIHIDNEKGKMTTKVISDYPKLYIPKIDFNNTPVANEPTEVSFTLQNNGTAAYHGDIYVLEKDASNAGIACDVEPGQTIELKVNYIPKKLGKNVLQVKDKFDILYEGDITVKETIFTDDVELKIDHQVTNAQGSVKEGFIVQGRKAKINLTVTNNTNKNYRGKIYSFTNYWNINSKTPIHSEYVENAVTVLAGETKIVQCESHELVGADAFSFSLSYTKNKKDVGVDIKPDAIYYAAPTYLTFDADGKVTDHLATEIIKADTTVCTIDLRGITGIKEIYAENPNVLYFVDEESNLTGNNVVKGSQADNIILTDGYSFYTPYRFMTRHISYTRLPERYFDVTTEKGWTTLTLPFAATGCQTTFNGTTIPLRWAQENDKDDADIIIFTNTYEEGNQEEFSYPGTTLETLHPYLLGVPSNKKNNVSLVGLPITFYADNAIVEYGNSSITGRNYKMVGSLKNGEAKDIYSLNNEGTAFVLGSTYVSPFRAYFIPITEDGNDQQLTIVSNFSPNPISEDGGFPDGINEIVQDSKTNNKIYNLNGVRVKNLSKGIYIINGKKVIK